METSEQITEHIKTSIAQGANADTATAGAWGQYFVSYDTDAYCVTVLVKNIIDTDKHGNETLDFEITIVDIIDEEGNDLVEWLNKNQEYEIQEACRESLPEDCKV